MDDQKHQLVDRIHQAQNILVTVSRNPNVDQLAAAIGLTLALNKLDKHATAVFSGQIPNTLEFLKPQDTIEKDTNGLRDFIIALDKSKADKLRYKVEDDVVRIFITPFRTSLTEKDLNFSQGDFNVDVVVALGVADQNDLDEAITAHGRILHDATIASLSSGAESSLGSINWADKGASSLSEMALSLLEELDKKVVDNQIATALLAGIVANTDRFSNSKTSPRTMSASASLMASGANQQLVATQLEPLTDPETVPVEQPQEQMPPQPKPDPGTLEIDHEAEEEEAPEPPKEPEQPQIKVDENGQIVQNDSDADLPRISHVRGGGTDMTPLGEKPVDRDDLDVPSGIANSEMPANGAPESYDPSTDELTLPALDAPLLSHNESVLTPPAPVMPGPQAPKVEEQPPAPSPTPNWQPPTPEPAPFAPAPQSEPKSPVSPSWAPPAPAPAPESASTANPTLSDIEKSVDSPHTTAANSAEPVLSGAQTVDDARSAVEAAIQNAASAPAEPIAALNAQPLGEELHPESVLPTQIVQPSQNEPTPGNTPADQTLDMPLPSNPFGPGMQTMSPPPALSPPPIAPTPPSAFPGVSPNGPASAGPPPPPVPPPMFPPQQ
jgi:hypothetical protein